MIKTQEFLDVTYNQEENLMQNFTVDHNGRCKWRKVMPPDNAAMPFSEIWV